MHAHIDTYHGETGWGAESGISIFGSFWGFLENLLHLQTHCVIWGPLSKQITAKKKIQKMKCVHTFVYLCICGGDQRDRQTCLNWWTYISNNCDNELPLTYNKTSKLKPGLICSMMLCSCTNVVGGLGFIWVKRDFSSGQWFLKFMDTSTENTGSVLCLWVLMQSLKYIISLILI